MKDFKREKSYLDLCKLTNRAYPSDYNDFKVARILISICKNSDPFTLFHVLLSVIIIIETLRQQRLWFVDSSRTRIARQSLANQVTTISKMLDYDWLDDISKDSQRVQTEENLLSPICLTYVTFSAMPDSFSAGWAS